MDRGDAAFVADVLERRISGDRDGLDSDAASSLMRLSTLAKLITQRAEGWSPALVASAEIMRICRDGCAAANDPAPPELQIFVDSLRKLAAEPFRPRNRLERRRMIANLPRVERVRRLATGRPHG